MKETHSITFSEEEYNEAKSRGNDYLYNCLAKDYIHQVIKPDTKLTISQKLYYPVLIEFVCYKVYNHTYEESPQNLKFLNGCCERFNDLFPELFI